MTKHQKRYDENFKKMVVELHQSGQSVEQLASEYGIASQTIYRWIKLYAKNSETGMSEAEMIALKKELAKMKEENANLKKGLDHIRSKVDQTEVIGFIEENSDAHSVKNMCAVLDLPRSSYYERINRKPSNHHIETKRLDTLITTIYWEAKGRYGAPKIWQKLRQDGEMISLKRVQKRMKALGLRSITVKKWRPVKVEKDDTQRKNLLKQDFTTTGLNQKWVTDITYIHTKLDGWCYLSTIQDLHTKKIIGWTFGKQMTTDLVMDTLTNALLNQASGSGLILHSDQGSQYTSKIYEEKLESLGIAHSFSRKGCPYDNAGIESFHASIKKEEVYPQEYRDYNEAHRSLFQYIEGFYNRSRIHSSIGYLTPNQMEQRALQVS
ncbi:MULTISPECIES: IS3 family transposase [Enterococcus]|uniref:IS3 family transposase n=1 Tax=Enterococcus TaxID=1350 RepID=UPI001F067823|nr:IS3 family transposase [Enterococcus hirae]